MTEDNRENYMVKAVMFTAVLLGQIGCLDRKQTA